MKHLSSFHIFESNSTGFVEVKTKPASGNTVRFGPSPSPEELKSLPPICEYIKIENAQIKDLKGFPKKVKLSLTVQGSDLETLKGCPKSSNRHIYYSFQENNLWTLEGAPKPKDFGDPGDLYVRSEEMLAHFKKMGTENKKVRDLIDKIHDTVAAGASIYFIDNLVDGQTLYRGYIKWVETGSWTPYYLDLLTLPNIPQEAREKAIARLSPAEIQSLIDEDPAKAALDLSKSWSKIKAIPKYSSVKFPDEFADDADDFADLSDLGF